MAPQQNALPRILHENKFERAPRFGHSNNFSHLFSPEQEVVVDYITGILVISLIILTAFLIWGFCLIVFKYCLGPERVGFLSGAQFRKRPKGKVNPWILRGRNAFGLSCLCFFCFSIVLVTAGIGNLNLTTSTMGDGALQGYDYLNEAQVSLNNVIATLELIVRVKNQLTSELRAFHEALKLAHAVKPGSDNAEGHSRGTVVDETVQAFSSGIDDLGVSMEGPLKDIDNTLASGQETCDTLYNATEQVDLFWLQLLVGFVTTIFPVLLLGYLYWNCFGAQQQRHPYLLCFRDWVIWPLFQLLVVGCTVLCCVMSIAGLLNADFCSGGQQQSPDATILEILIQQGVHPESFEYVAVDYMVHGCDINAVVTQEHPLADVEELKQQLNNTLLELRTTIDTMVETGLEILSNETGQNATALAHQIEEFRVPLTDLFTVLGEFLQHIACRPLYQIYFTVVQKATCNDSYSGTFWTFMSLLMMSFFGLVAITFRTALYPVQEAEKWEHEKLMEELDAHPNETELSRPEKSDIDFNGTNLSSLTLDIGNNTVGTSNPSLLGQRSEQPHDETAINSSTKVPPVDQSSDRFEDEHVIWRESSNSLLKKYVSPDETFEVELSGNSIQEKGTHRDPPQFASHRQSVSYAGAAALQSSATTLNQQPNGTRIHPSWTMWLSPDYERKNTKF